MVNSSENNLSLSQISSIEVVRKWIYLLQSNSAFNIIYEWSFSALKRLKRKIRFTTQNNPLNHLIYLYVHQEKIVKVDIHKTAIEFIARKESRKEQFSL